MSGSCPERALPSSDTGSPASTRTPPRSRACATATFPYSSQTSTAWSPPTCARGGSISPPTCRSRSPRPTPCSSPSARRRGAAAVSGFTVVVTKSTVPVGTGDEVERIMSETRPDADLAVVSNPEFLREGAAIQDFKHPDRIVVGTADERAKKVMSDLYRPLYLNQAPMLYTTRRTAELIKYAANAFLATKITFINEIADLCEKVGGDVQQVARGIGLDNRIGGKFLHAGPGFGGSCFPKD